MGRQFVLFLFSCLMAGQALACPPIRGEDPEQRDSLRMQCFRHQLKSSTWASCLQQAKGFEYLSNSQYAVGLCLFERNIKQGPLFSQCLQATRLIDTSNERDDIAWACLEKLRLILTKKECVILSAQITSIPLKERTQIFCQEEIKSAQSRSK